MKKKEAAVHRKYISSPIGVICLEDDGEALTGLYVAEDAECYLEGAAIAGAGQEKASLGSSPLLDEAERQLSAYFAGERTSFDLPLHLRGTEFQQRVWEALRRIPYGETRSYSELARMIGHPKACRAVGGANNRNPIMIIVPCHRVVGADGSLTGFGGGLPAKQYLLALESDVAYAGGTVCGSRNTENNCSNAKENLCDAEPENGCGGRNTENNCSNAKENLCDAEQENDCGGRKEAVSVKMTAAETLQEQAALYTARRQGEYTLKDYYAFPKGRRIELIDGTIYDMGAPTVSHQSIGGLIYMRLMSYVFSKKGRCIPLIAPVDVQLDCDDRTMVQPDVLVVCDRDKVMDHCVYGAPDFVVEVLSGSSLRRDTILKLDKYKRAGVREYWIIDVKHEKVIVYQFEANRSPQIYGMDDTVPVGIFDGGCAVDFAKLLEQLHEWIG